MTNLTEQWKRGELPSDCYYIRHKHYKIRVPDCCHKGKFSQDWNVAEVVAKVPSYDHFSQLVKKVEELKDLLKRAQEFIDTFAEDEVCSVAARAKKLNAKIDEVLKDE